MPIHAVLGATGGTGSAILRCLLSSQIPDLRINILVRSKSKLLQAFPQIELTSSATITIFEAPISNEDTLKACLKGASIIYACIATNHASRKVDIALTTAARLVAALDQLCKDQGPEYKTPVVVFNRSMALNSDIQMPIPGFAKRFMVFAVWAIYEDLLKAGALYARAEKDGLLTCITADPPGLMDPKGTDATGYKFLQRGKSTASMNYADFGRAMVELGQRREEFGGKIVGVSATGPVRIVFFANLWIILLGLKSRLIPL
jgi:nucleoside-diphosphate-sugar epimerase